MYQCLNLAFSFDLERNKSLVDWQPSQRRMKLLMTGSWCGIRLRDVCLFIGGKKNRQKERRLMKGFNLASVGGTATTGGQAGSISSLVGTTGAHPATSSGPRSSVHTLNENFSGSSPCPSTHQPGVRSPVTRLAQLARLAGAKKVDSKKKWGNLIDAARSAKAVRMWPRSRSRSEDSVSSECSGSQPHIPVPDESAPSGRFKSRSTHSHVQITENELPEVLEETSIDWELSGRMGIDPNWVKWTFWQFSGTINQNLSPGVMQHRKLDDYGTIMIRLINISLVQYLLKQLVWSNVCLAKTILFWMMKNIA